MLTPEFYSPALVTLVSVFMLQRFTIAVGKARAAYGVHPPKTTGNEKFEQVFRVHQNTLEQYPTFIVGLWMCSYSFSPLFAFVAGLFWLATRVYYFYLYTNGQRVQPATIPGYMTVIALCGTTFLAILKQLYLDYVK